MTNEHVQYEDKELVTGKDNRLWTTAFGKMIRWFIYIPTALILLTAVKMIIYLLFCMPCDVAGSLVIACIVLVMLIAIIPLAMVAYYFIILLATKIICPNPKRGSIAFFIIYLGGEMGHASAIIDSEPGASFITIPLAVLLLLFITATKATWNVYIRG